MKRAALFFSGGILTTLALCVAGASSQAPLESSEIGQLKKEIAELRQRVQSLEDRMKGRTFAVPRDSRDHSIITVRPYAPGQAPKDWKPFEFNGRTYYVVPISNDANTPAPSNELLHK